MTIKEVQSTKRHKCWLQQKFKCLIFDSVGIMLVMNVTN